MSPRRQRISGAGLAALEAEPPAPAARGVLYLLLALIVCAFGWMTLGSLDVVAVAPGKLVPQSFVKVVQPAEGGILREILVAEGDTVAAGQVVARMDRRVAETDLAALADELARRRLQVRRIDAELGGALFPRARDDPAALHAQVDAQLRARREAHADALAGEQALRARSVHELGAATELETKLRRVEPIQREQAQAWALLAREGYAGRLLALERQRPHLETEQDLKAQANTVEGLRASIAQADQRIAQLRSGYRRQLHEERAEAKAALARLEQEQAKQAYRHALLELTAPQAGVVKDLATHTPGAVVAPGTVVMTLVPRDEPLLAEVWLSNADAGYVRPGQTARVKVAAFPFQKHGLLEGVVAEIGADAQDAARRPERAAPAAAELAYRARVRLSAPGPALELMAGMAVSAEVHVGRRTPLEYLLSPIRKVTAEAGRER